MGDYRVKMKTITRLLNGNDAVPSSSIFPGTERYDFLRLLGEKTDHSLVISKILSYLPGPDLQSITKVSKTWKRLCLNDKVSNLRLKKYVLNSRAEKENTESIMLSMQQSNESTPRKRKLFSCWRQNCQFTDTKETPGSPPISPKRAKFELFVKEGKKLNKKGKLASCPKCTLPSHVNEEEGSGSCTLPSCSYLFCLKCLCPHHPGSGCKYFITSSPSSSPSKIRHTVGSRQSRKALRRL